MSFSLCLGRPQWDLVRMWALEGRLGFGLVGEEYILQLVDLGKLLGVWC